jgi:hypothetical protein
MTNNHHRAAIQAGNTAYNGFVISVSAVAG